MASKRKVKSREFIDDSDDPEDTGAKTKKSKVSAVAAKNSDTESDDLIPLSAKRFVNVRTFKGRIMVDIREYYEDDAGERKPGKKGISLSVDQWEKLKDVMEVIDERIHNS